MKNYVLICLSMMISCFVFGQSKPIHPDKVLRAGRKAPKVLLVGTFHFGYPGLDEHKTDEAYKIDILSPQKQKEVKELVDYIARFKPTKIMVESGPNTGYLMHEYRRWKKGEDELDRQEIDQICYRLLDQFHLDTLYGVDAASFSRQYSRSAKDSASVNPIFRKIYANTDVAVSDYDDRYWEWYDLDDKWTYEMPLLEYFKYQNSDIVINRMHGHYILSDESKDYNAVDGLALNWYSRNLRIFKNIQTIDTDENDRILVLFGAGHLAILKQQFSASPEYDLVSFGELK